VYTRLVGIIPDLKGESIIQADMRQNDNDKGNMDALAFSKQVTITAQWNATGAYASLDPYLKEVTFDEDNLSDGTDGAPIVGKELLYTMNFGEQSPAPTTPGGTWTGGWGQCDDEANNGKPRTVTAYYSTPAVPLMGVDSATTVRSAKIPTHFSNIHIK